MARNQKDCPYCHHETRKKHYVLLTCHYFANDDNYVEATVDINTDKSMSLIVGVITEMILMKLKSTIVRCVGGSYEN